MIKYDIAINNTTIIDEEGKIHTNKSIGIKDGDIVYVNNDSIKAIKTIDGSDKVITSTFANGHVHSPMNILKGIAEDVSLDDWFNDRIWPYESSLIPEDIEVGTKLGVLEMINNGISVFAEHYFMEESIIKAVKETGIRIDLAPTIFSGDDFDERIEKTIELNNKYHDHKNICITWGPHSTYMCTPEDLEVIGKLANKHDMKIHTHIGETKRQLVEHKEKYHESPMQTLDRIGVLDERLILAHSLHFDQEDLKLFTDKHFIPLSPKTYMKLAMDLESMIDNLDSFNWGFGTDGGASSSSLNILEQARLFGLYYKYVNNDATELKLKTLWKKIIKTHNAFDFNTGIIKDGMAADLIIWNLNKVNTLPNYNLLASIIYSSNSENIESVIINGKIVKENNQVIGFDKEFIEKVTKHKQRILDVGKGKSNLKF